jgi:hypothetical protein
MVPERFADGIAVARLACHRQFTRRVVYLPEQIALVAQRDLNVSRRWRNRPFIVGAVNCDAKRLLRADAGGTVRLTFSRPASCGGLYRRRGSRRRPCPRAVARRRRRSASTWRRGEPLKDHWKPAPRLHHSRLAPCREPHASTVAKAWDIALARRNWRRFQMPPS